MIAEFQNFEPYVVDIERRKECISDFIERKLPNDPLDTHTGSQFSGRKGQTVAAANQDHIARGQHSDRSGKRCEADHGAGIERLKQRYGCGEILRDYVAGRHGYASGACQAGKNSDDGKGSHWVTLLICWYISSAAFTTFEFAS